MKLKLPGTVQPLLEFQTVSKAISCYRTVPYFIFSYLSKKNRQTYVRRKITLIKGSELIYVRTYILSNNLSRIVTRRII